MRPRRCPRHRVFAGGTIAQTDVEGEVICCEGPKDNAPSFAYDAKRIERLKHAGVDVDKTYSQDELARGSELVFAALGITKGELLDGVRLIPNGAIVNSICVRLPSGTVERSETTLHFKGHPVYEQFYP